MLIDRATIFFILICIWLWYEIKKIYIYLIIWNKREFSVVSHHSCICLKLYTVGTFSCLQQNWIRCNAWKSHMLRSAMFGFPSKPAVRDNFHDSELTIWYTTIQPGMNYVRGNSQRIELRNVGNNIDQRRGQFLRMWEKREFWKRRIKSTN